MKLPTVAELGKMTDIVNEPPLSWVVTKQTNRLNLSWNTLVYIQTSCIEWFKTSFNSRQIKNIKTEMSSDRRWHTIIFEKQKNTHNFGHTLWIFNTHTLYIRLLAGKYTSNNLMKNIWGNFYFIFTIKKKIVEYY